MVKCDHRLPPRRLPPSVTIPIASPTLNSGRGSTGYTGARLHSVQLRALDRDVAVDDPVIVDVHEPVVVEGAVEPAVDRPGKRGGGVDLAVVVDVDDAVEVRIAAVGVDDEGVTGMHRLPGDSGRCRA